MPKNNGRRATANADIPEQPNDTIDIVYPRQVYEALRAKWPTMYTPDEHAKINAAIAAGRTPFAFSKSANGTKGLEDAAEKPFTVVRDLNDNSVLIANVSPVRADITHADGRLLAYWIHVFTAVAGFTADDKPNRVYTKDGFATVAKRIGLVAPAGKKENAYTFFTVISPYLQNKLEGIEIPHPPFVVPGTRAAGPKRTFVLQAYDADRPAGRNAIVGVKLINPAHPGVTEADCVNHAALYAHLTFLTVSEDRPDLAAALEFVRVETLADQVETLAADIAANDEQETAIA